MRIALFSLLVLVLALAACGGAEEPEVHAVRGQVVKVLKDGGELVVDHEDIDGYMAAMQMSIPVGDPEQARGLAPGDKVRFTLHIAERGPWIDAIERLPADTELQLASPGR